MKKLKEKNKNRLITIGSFLVIVICLIIIGFEVFSMNQIKENNEALLNDFFEEQEVIAEQEENVSLDIKEEQKPIQEIKEKESYIGVIEIKKINLTQGFYNINSKNNDVNKNIQVIKESNMPDVIAGNLIIAGHSGNGKYSYFRNLKKLEIKDEAIVHYQGKSYEYTLVDKYEINKDGTAKIKRNKNKNILTLITCKENSNKQIVFIFELKTIN